MKTKTKIRAGLLPKGFMAIDGESTDDAHGKWIDVLSVAR